MSSEPPSFQPLQIVLLTDFGHQDSYVGVLKGVISGICPEIKVIDLCHEIPAGQINWGAWQLWSAYRYFPAGTIFVCVVDPGVGSERNAIALLDQGKVYIGPDNGLLSWAVPEAQQARVLDNPRWHLNQVSRTFHGRDIFSPVAAHLAAGVGFEQLGSDLTQYQQLDWPEPVVDKTPDQVVIAGEILLWDRFGNLITNISDNLLQEFDPAQLQVEVGPWRIKGLSGCYRDAAGQQPMALFGSSGLLELSLPCGNAQAALQAEPGRAVRVFVTAT